MSINHHNFDYAAGPTFPEAVGDRYYCQDLARDYWSKIDDAGKKVAAGFTAFPVLLKDSNMTKGTNWDDLDIPAAKGIVEFEVDVPLSYAALPPTVTQEDIYVRIETSAETDFDISGATLDGVTTNYVKVTYNETNGSSRTRAKKAGTYVYEKAISYTITVTPAAPTNKDLVLGTVVGDGATFLTIVSYPRTRRYGDEYDYVVSSQDEFNIIIDRTAANQYRIKDNVKSIYVKYLSGGYQMTGATSPLQGGDAYGYIETNDCTRIVFEPGSFIDMHQNIGYIEVDTDYCYLDGVSVQGDKGAASAIQRSFLLNANYVTFNKCDSQLRLSNVEIIIFEGSGTAKHNETVNVIGCRTEDIDSSNNVYCFRYMYNIVDCIMYNIESTANVVYGIANSKNASNCFMKQFDGASTASGIINSTECENIYMEDFDSSAGGCEGLNTVYNAANIYMEDFDGILTRAVFNSKRVTNIYIYDFNSTAGYCYGFHNTTIISNSEINQLDATGNCYAYFSCDIISACSCEDIDSSGGNYHGYFNCTQISASYATTCENGFDDCKEVVGCKAEINDNDGFNSCDDISGCRGATNGNDGFNGCTCITACRGNNNTGNGYDGCNTMTANRAAGNTGAQYNNSFADLAGLNACADTNLGGYNG